MAPRDKAVLIWGAGAVGGTLGAFLARAGMDVTVVDVSVNHVQTIRERGLRIVGPQAQFSVPIRVFTPDTLEGTWPLAFLAVKGQYTVPASHCLARHLDADGGVLSLQNGLAGAVMAEIIGRERSYAALVDIAADVLDNGEIRFGFNHPMPIGVVHGGSGPLLEDFVQIVRIFDPAAFGTPDVRPYIWGKNIFSTITCSTAMALSPMADLVLRPDLEPLWRVLTGEMIAVARAEGVEPVGVAPFDPQAFAPEAPRALGKQYLRELATASRNGKPHSGMWRDLAIHRRQTEVAALLAPVCKLGQARGLRCRGLAATVAMIAEIERGERRQEDANLVRLLEHVI